MDVQHNGEEIVEDKDQDNGKNNGCRCSLAYPFGPLLSIKALMASDDGDDGTKNGTFDEAAHKVPRFNEATNGFDEHMAPDSGLVHSNKPAADITDEVGINNQDGHHEHNGEKARGHKILGWTGRHNA